MTDRETHGLIRRLESIASRFLDNPSDRQDAAMDAILSALKNNASDATGYALSSIGHRSIEIQRRNKHHAHAGLFESKSEPECAKSARTMHALELLNSCQPVFDRLHISSKRAIRRTFVGDEGLPSAEKSALRRARGIFRAFDLGEAR